MRIGFSKLWVGCFFCVFVWSISISAAFGLNCRKSLASFHLRSLKGSYSPSARLSFGVNVFLYATLLSRVGLLPNFAWFDFPSASSSQNQVVLIGHISKDGKSIVLSLSDQSEGSATDEVGYSFPIALGNQIEELTSSDNR